MGGGGRKTAGPLARQLVGADSQSNSLSPLCMSARPKRASALAALASMRGLHNVGANDGRKGAVRTSNAASSSALSHNFQIAASKVPEESKAKRRRTNQAASAGNEARAPQLPGDIWALVMVQMYTHVLRPAEYYALRTVEKSWAAATTQQSQQFWQSLSCKLLSADVDSKIIEQHYCGSWYCFVRYWCAAIGSIFSVRSFGRSDLPVLLHSFSSKLATPSLRGNLLGSGYVAPFEAPACPKVKWVYRPASQNDRSDHLFAPSLTSWGDGCAFLTKGGKLVRLSLPGGVAEVWSHQLASPANLPLAILASELSAEIRVEPSRDDLNADHLDFLRAKSVIALCASTHVYSFNWETGEKEWEINLPERLNATAVGGMSVLPHCVILTIKENAAPCTLTTTDFKQLAVPILSSLRCSICGRLGNCCS